MAYDLAQQRGNRAKSLVGFVVGTAHCAVDIFRVQEIIHPLPFVALPNAPPDVLGVTDHRGEVLPVLDLRRRFGYPQLASGHGKWLIVRTKDASVALSVDAVTDVFGTAESEERRVPEAGLAARTPGLIGMCVQDGRLVFLLDVDVITAPAQQLDLAALVEQASAPKAPAPKFTEGEKPEKKAPRRATRAAGSRSKQEDP